jgi:hypothetical protein
MENLCIFFWSERSMYYLIGAGLLFVISIIVFIQGRKKEKLTI